MFKKPNPKQNFFELEQEILKFWKSENILDKSINQRPDDKSKTFYDGPITANGAPHMGHALTFSMKDIIPRYWTMKGYKVNRSLGWDCQGLPVEYEIEKSLGFTEKKDIEKFGIAKFNELCRNLVLEKRDKIIELEEMVGRLTNSEEEYATMDATYIESVWWSLKELHTKGLLYEGFKVVPYSTRAGTTLSNAEVALGGYKNFVDPAITVEFPLEEDPMVVLLAWTTTPWTIPGNLGLAVGKEINYVKVKKSGSDKAYILAKDLVESIFKDLDHTIVSEVKAEELIGKKYIPPFAFYKGRKNAHVIYEGSHVTTDSGTGIVHLAPYGAEDNELFQKVGIESFDYLDDQGDFKSDIAPYSGVNYRDANTKIIEDLKQIGVLFKHEDYEHEMPMCWRTNTPLIYKPITSWYIAMSTLRADLVANNEKINWNPKHVKNGRFGNWLAEIKDWGISRSRYWGTPLPIWKSESGKTIVIGSYEELKKYSGVDITDPHRPFIDDVVFEFEGENYKRILDVLDVWYDSGAMPFARFHYPFENKEKFDAKFPAEYIAEGIDQTRGWFYSLLAESTALFGKESYKNVLINGTIVADDGAKLSKSKKNYVEPDILIKEFGADAVRINFFSSPIASGEDAAVSPKTLKIQTQEWILPIWNIFAYLTTYANIHNWTPSGNLALDKRSNNNLPAWDHMPFENVSNELNAWILFRLQETIHNVTLNLDAYDIQKSIRFIKELIDDTSKWYIRSSRDNFADGNLSSIETLYYVFIESMKLLAPFAPFVTDYIYQQLVKTQVENALESIHLSDYPEVDLKFVEQYSSIANEMQIVRKICEMGHTIRVTNSIKVRQPLAELQVQSLNETVPVVSAWMSDLIAKELNIKSILDKANVHETETIKVIEDSTLKIKIGVETKLSQELKDEGFVREITRSIQAQRKKLGFQQGELINVWVKSENSDILATIKRNVESIKKTVSAKSFEFKDDFTSTFTIEIESAKIELEIGNT
jgi:isoleucyl-tRNA synthetase